jgi:hypothetical protein
MPNMNLQRYTRTSWLDTAASEFRAGYRLPWGFSRYSAVSTSKCRDNISIRPRHLPSKSFLIHTKENNWWTKHSSSKTNGLAKNRYLIPSTLTCTFFNEHLDWNLTADWSIAENVVSVVRLEAALADSRVLARYVASCIFYMRALFH